MDRERQEEMSSTAADDETVARIAHEADRQLPIYRAQLLPGFGDPTRDDAFYLSVANHCFETGLVGIGWQLDPPPSAWKDAFARTKIESTAGWGLPAANTIRRCLFCRDFCLGGRHCLGGRQSRRGGLCLAVRLRERSIDEDALPAREPL